MALYALRHNHNFRTARDLNDPDFPRNGFYIGSGAEATNLHAIAAVEAALKQGETTT